MTEDKEYRKALEKLLEDQAEINRSVFETLKKMANAINGINDNIKGLEAMLNEKEV